MTQLKETRMIKPNTALQAMLEGNETARELWEQANDGARDIINVFANMSRADQEIAAELFKTHARERKESDKAIFNIGLQGGGHN